MGWFGLVVWVNGLVMSCVYPTVIFLGVYG